MNLDIKSLLSIDLRYFDLRNGHLSGLQGTFEDPVRVYNLT